MGAQMKEAMSHVDDRDLDRTQAIIRGIDPRLSGPTPS